MSDTQSVVAPGSAEFDVIVIGAGPGGYVSAIRCAQLGLKTAIVEKDARLGGTCLLRGCIPTKALLESAHLYEKMKGAKKFGIVASGVEVNFAGVQKARARAVAANSKGVGFLMKKNDITVLNGLGRLAGGGAVDVIGESGTDRVQAKHIVLATGSRCKDFPGIEMDHVRTVNSDDILELKSIPKSLVVMGAGAVGTEFASVYAAFGSKTTLVEYMDHVLPLEDDEIAAELEKSLKRSKIKVHTSASVGDVELIDGGVRLSITPRDGGDAQTVEAEMLLVAVGRAPVTEGLGLEQTQVVVGKDGKIETDAYGRTGEPNVWAIGDVIAGPALAHKASHEGVMVAELIAGNAAHATDHGQIPNCTYCQPEVASVGLTERAAKAAGYDVKVGKFPFSASGKARIMGQAVGMVKIVADKQYDQVLGVHIVGPKATELISEAALGLHLETTVEELMRTVHPHPTLAEAMGEAAAAAFNGAPLNA